MPGFVYILKNNQNKFYIGSTNNLKRRLQQHKNDHTQTSKNMVNPKMVLSQQYDTIEKAREVEKRIKKLKRKDYIERMVSDGYLKI